MNNIITNFKQIMDFAEKSNVPLNSRRAILREYLQSRIIAVYYTFPQMSKMAFIGGTALRLLRDLDRFSEDLDFDNLGLTDEEIKRLTVELVKRLERENIAVEMYVTESDGKFYIDLRFPSLLFDLAITSNPKEKLKIKIDYSRHWQGQDTEAVLFSKYGFIERVITIPLNQVMVQKIHAYVFRKQTQTRDMYDIVWLYSKGARIDVEFAQRNQLDDLLEHARAKYAQEGIRNQMRARLQPFLFSEGGITRLDLFSDVLNALAQSS
jgi:predicted nucleotidyltransferase component of viral defense system